MLWKGMLNRCDNPNGKSYKDYGARGIGVCERWREFVNFRDDMGQGYERGLTIERIDNNRGYEPGNCQWIPKSEQSKNRRAGSQWNFKHTPTSKNTSGIRGVSWLNRDKKWLATITINGKARRLGTFLSKEEAGVAYQVAAQELRSK